MRNPAMAATAASSAASGVGPWLDWGATDTAGVLAGRDEVGCQVFGAPQRNRGDRQIGVGGALAAPDAGVMGRQVADAPEPALRIGHAVVGGGSHPQSTDLV